MHDNKLLSGIKSYLISSIQENTIRIKYHIDSLNDTKITRVFQFDRRHEDDFETLYKITEEKIEKKAKIDLEQLLIFWAFRFSKECRKKTSFDGKLGKIFENKIGRDILQGIKEISFEAQIDDLPKQNLIIPITDQTSVGDN